jgi:large subunit GTPase 1
LEKRLSKGLFQFSNQKVEEENYQITITPYEKNIEVWRQLWRVIEKSDIIVQIVDGRDPLFFHC